MKKNIFDKFQDWLVGRIQKFENREDRDVLAKIPFWIIVFFPYAFYLFIFKSKVKKVWKYIVSILLSLLIILGVDTALYPNRAYNDAAKVAYNNFVSDNKDLKLEELKYVSKNNHFEVDGQMYFLFDIYDRLNMYKVIFKVDNYSKDYEVASVYDIDYNFSNIYANSKFKQVGEIHPNILPYLFSTIEELKLEDIKKVSDVKESDIFNNDIYQTIKAKNEIYDFEFNDFTISKVYNSTKKETLLDIDKSKAFTGFLPTIVTKMLNQDFKSNYRVVGYNYFNSKHFFNIEVGEGLYVVEYLPGSQAELFIVDDLDVFKKYFIGLVYK